MNCVHAELLGMHGPPKTSPTCVLGDISCGVKSSGQVYVTTYIGYAWYDSKTTNCLPYTSPFSSNVLAMRSPLPAAHFTRATCWFDSVPHTEWYPSGVHYSCEIMQPVGLGRGHPCETLLGFMACTDKRGKLFCKNIDQASSNKMCEIIRLIQSRTCNVRAHSPP